MIKIKELKGKNRIEVTQENSKQKSNFSFRITICGAVGVGKTSIVFRKNIKSIKKQPNSTKYYDHDWVNFKIKDIVLTLHFWDTCGDELYHPLIKHFYTTCSLVYIVFALNDMDSFEKVNELLKEIREICGEDRIVILIGNKKDLIEQRVVTEEIVGKFMDENKVNYYIETSASTGENIDELFIQTAKIIYFDQVVSILNDINNGEKFPNIIDLNNPNLNGNNCKDCLCCNN